MSEWPITPKKFSGHVSDSTGKGGTDSEKNLTEKVQTW